MLSYITLSYFCTAPRLNNFQIGTTSISPAVEAPWLYNYAVCATRSGSLGAGAYETFICSAQARYVIIQLRWRGYLTLCEVEVFGGW